MFPTLMPFVVSFCGGERVLPSPFPRMGARSLSTIVLVFS